MKNWTGKELLKLGCPEGRVIGNLLRTINKTPHSTDEVLALIEAQKPPPALELHAQPAPCEYNITAHTADERANLDAVRATMNVVLRTPCVIEGVVMPDACPAGPVGTIPVGGVVATKDAIVPGMHSADICCSLMATVFKGDVSPAAVLDAAHKQTHFGPGGRDERPMPMSDALREKVDALPYPAVRQTAASHLGTQGDGNHFLYVGTLESTGQTVMVTHHGSRAPGARLFKVGKEIAERYRKQLSPDTHPANAWIPYHSDDGKRYWDALQVIRDWTKENHSCLHEATANAVATTVDMRFWNEHNFVFREVVVGDNGETDEGVIWHAKGATPVHTPLLPDTNGVQIIPLNMAEPILFVKGTRHAKNRGFAPHGAGRNMSRTKHKKRFVGIADEEVYAKETQAIDARFYCGKPDISELPSAYKNAAAVQQDITRFDLCDIIDRVQPYGCIMAGDWKTDPPWRKKKKR